MAPVEPVLKLTTASADVLLDELLCAYSSTSFQRKLVTIAEKAVGHKVDRSSFLKGDPFPLLQGRQALAFAVQSEIMSRYGFGANEDGVIAMKFALRSMLSDPALAEKSRAIRFELRLPQMSSLTQKFSPSCQGLQMSDSPSVSQSTKAPTKLDGSSPSMDNTCTLRICHATDKTQPVINLKLDPHDMPTFSDVKKLLAVKLGDEAVKDAKFVMRCGTVMIGHLDIERIGPVDTIYITDVHLRKLAKYLD